MIEPLVFALSNTRYAQVKAALLLSKYPIFGVENWGSVTGYKDYYSDNKRFRNMIADHMGHQTSANPYDEHKGP